MPSFESPIGNKNFSTTNLREFEVADESQDNMQKPMQRPQNSMHDEEQDVSKIEREIRAAREAKRTGKERLGDGAKRRIEVLIGMSRLKREVNIEGNVFAFQTLKAKEMREVVMAASEFDGTVQSVFEVRKQFLARSITHVAGVEFEAFIGSNDLETKLLFIEELDDSLLNRLYSEYLILSKDSRERYAIKNDNDAKEVIEDLKK
jgi:hypothetical protein